MEGRRAAAERKTKAMRALGLAPPRDFAFRGAPLPGRRAPLAGDSCFT